MSDKKGIQESLDSLPISNNNFDDRHRIRKKHKIKRRKYKNLFSLDKFYDHVVKQMDENNFKKIEIDLTIGDNSIDNDDDIQILNHSNNSNNSYYAPKSMNKSIKMSHNIYPNSIIHCHTPIPDIINVNDVLTTDLDKQNYKNLMKIPEKRIEHVPNQPNLAGKYAAEFIKETQQRQNNSKKRKLSDSRDMEQPNKKRKLSNNVTDNSINIYKQQIAALKQANENLILKNKISEERNDVMQKRLNLLECESKTINAMSLNELNELKITMREKMKLIEESERQLMENTFKCVACMDNLRNISFEGGCNHMSLCDKCESELQSKKCPICQTPYTNAKKIKF